MQLDQISLELSDAEVRVFEFHPGLTVVEADDGGERGLAAALIGCLGKAGDGVHVEFRTDSGDGFIAFRPRGAAHRVIDLDTSEDRTDWFHRADGGIDILSAWRTDHPHPESALLFGPADLAHADPTDMWVNSLAAHDPTTLFELAERAVALEQAVVAASGPTPAGAAIAPTSQADPLVHVRAKADAAEARHDLARRLTLWVGFPVALGAIPAYTITGNAWIAAGFLGTSLAITGLCTVHEGRLASAIRAETRAAALAAAGNTEAPTPLAAEESGASLPTTTVAQRYRDSSASWQEVAGAIPAAWVLEEWNRVEAAAVLRRALTTAPSDADANVDVSTVDSDAAQQSADPHPATEAGANDGRASGALTPHALAESVLADPVVAGVLTRAATLRTLSDVDQILPIFIEAPVSDDVDRASFLEFLSALSAQQQVIVVTADPDLLSWARVEAMTGSLKAIVGDPVAADATIAAESDQQS